MATKPKTPSTAVAIKASTNLVSVQEAMKAELAGLASRTDGSPKKIKYEGDKFTLPSGAMFQAPMRAVIVDFNTQHSLFEGSYVKGKVSPIICAANGDNPKEMKPYGSIADPQCGDCTGCWANQFESASQGKGKACKQVRTLALLVEDAQGVIDPNGPIYLMQTNVTANKIFDAFVKSVAAVFQTPPVGVTVELGIAAEAKWDYVTYNNPVANDDLVACYARKAEAKAMLAEEIAVAAPTPEEKKAPARGKPVAARR